MEYIVGNDQVNKDIDQIIVSFKDGLIFSWNEGLF